MISPIKCYSYSPVYTNFTSTPEVTKSTDTVVEELEKGNQKKFKIKKYSELSDKQKKGVLYASIALAGLTGLVIGRGRSLSRSSWMMDEISRTSERYLAASEELTRVKAELEELKAIYETSSGSESALRRVTSELREKFTELVESDLSPREIREQIFARMRALIEENPLSYDPMSPPITGKGIRRFEDAVELPAAGTNIRANMQPLQIPLISESGEFRFVLPRGEMRVSKMTSKDFVPVYKQPTTISIGYADALNWDNDKVARDILQNFFDGHGQTLDGVRFEFVPVGNGKFRVRISGDSTYTVDKALFMGESTKRNDARSAGNYGEGLKMAVLKLLKSGGADSVRVGSDNWKLTYELADTDLTDKQILSYSIDKVEKLDGNFLEFETTDRDLLVKLRDSINRFYHSGNEHFKTPGFENRFVGIKTDLGPNDKGGIYIAGQRFEYDGNYSDFDNSVLFIKEKPDARTLDVSRDRISLSHDELGKLGGWVATHGENYIGISENEALRLIQSLEKYWGKVYKDDKNKGFDAFLTSFVDYFAILHKDIHIKFPEKCVAYSPASPDVVADLESKGYMICKDEFAKLGMPTIRELMGDARAHDVVKPTEIQEKKLKILKEAIRILGRNMEGKHFSAEELDTKIFIFDAKGAKDSKLYSDTRAEAIVDAGVTKGFWIDKEYLDNGNFAEILETCLHELSHKAGGDETASFSYQLTRVNADAIDALINNVPALHEIQALTKIWESLV
ncbi:hypothetical protein J6A64_04345 [bacterium]|nr:hypothetical protein [bacterium]